MTYGRPMTTKPPTPRVVVAGGGVAALEAILALRALAGRLPAITLVAPEPEFAPPAASVASPFGFGLPTTLPLEPFAATYGVRLRHGALARVDTDATGRDARRRRHARVRPSAHRGRRPPAGGGAQRRHLPRPRRRRPRRGGARRHGGRAGGAARRDRPLPRDLAAAGLRARDHGRRRAPLARARRSRRRARDAGDAAARGLRTGRRGRDQRTCCASAASRSTPRAPRSR